MSFNDKSVFYRLIFGDDLHDAASVTFSYPLGFFLCADSKSFPCQDLGTALVSGRGPSYRPTDNPMKCF